MTRKEAIIFCISLLNGIKERNERNYPEYADNVKQAIEALSEELSLHDGLDEAAEEHAGLNFDRQMEYKSFWHDVDTFKAGAEWKAKKIEVELEKEIKTWIPAHIIGGDEAPWKETKDVIIQWAEIVARYFFELGRKSS